MKRAAHVLAVVLAVVAAVLMALQQIPSIAVRFAAPLAIAVALVANLRTALKGAIDRGLVALFALLFLGHALFGCATLSGAAKACAPPTTDETQAIVTLFSRTDLQTAEAIAIAEGSKVAMCVVTEIARNILGQASGNQLALSLLPTAPSPLLERASQWLAKHPQ